MIDLTCKKPEEFARDVLHECVKEYDSFEDAKTAALDALSDGEALAAWGFTADVDAAEHGKQASFVESACAYLESLTGLPANL